MEKKTEGNNHYSIDNLVDQFLLLDKIEKFSEQQENNPHKMSIMKATFTF